jgi:hypothetical protein
MIYRDLALLVGSAAFLALTHCRIEAAVLCGLTSLGASGSAAASRHPKRLKECV